MITAVARGTHLACWALALISLAACAQDDIGPPHPVDGLDYPVEVTADPRGEVVWVTSGNFDLQYNGAAVLAARVVDHEWVPDAAVEVGSYAGPFAIYERNGQPIAGYVMSREENALYHVELGGEADSPAVDCEGGRRIEGLLRCPEELPIDQVDAVDEEGEDATLSVGSDPYGTMVRKAVVGLDENGEPQEGGEVDLLLTGALINGFVGTFELDAAGTPTLVGTLDIDNGLFDFAENPVSRRIYTTTKDINELQVLEVVPPDPRDDQPLLNPWVRLVKRVAIPEVEGRSVTRGRNLAVSSDGTRLYVAYRFFNSVVVLDVSTPDSTPRDQVLAKIPVGINPGGIEVVPKTEGLPELIYVSCFGSDRIDVIDPQHFEVIDSIPTARGPFGMAFVDNPELNLRRLYVANFYDHSVGVIELDPTSPWFHTQVAEIR